MEKDIFLSAVLSKTLSKPGPNNRSPEKGRMHNLNLDAESPDQVLSQTALLATIGRPLALEESFMDSVDASAM